MLKRFLARKQSFFESFQQSADLMHIAAGEFYHAVQNITDLQRSVDLIAGYEAQGDAVTYATFERLHKTFITPFDRNDIHELTACLDDILDLIHSCAQRLPYYHMDTVPPHLVELTHLCLQATLAAKNTVALLHSLKESTQIFKLCREIGDLQDQAHSVVIAGEQELFVNMDDFKEFFKCKDLYARIKSIINRCNDLANIITGIVLEYS